MPDRWSLPEAGPFRTVEHEWIEMPDGVRLSARLWIPETSSRVPVVLEYIPYRKRDLYRAIDDHWGPVLAAHGIAFARVDVRGTGDSEGVIVDEYSPAELNDGVACIAWLAARPWSNGNVGMRGISWGGINTLQIAAMRPSALKAILPMCCTDNRYTDDAHYIGGALARANFQWGTLFKLVMAGPPDPAIVGPRWAEMWRGRLEATPSILSDWTSHQRFDPYWQRGSVAIDWDAIQCPAYLVGGWLDTYCNPILRLLENLRVPRKALIGPWGHTYPSLAEPVGLDWKFEELRWWHQWLNGADAGIMQEPMFRAFMPYATAAESPPGSTPGRWIAEESWPPASVRTRALFLQPNGLADTSGSDGRASVPTEEPVGLSKPEWLNRLPFEQSRDDANSLTFDSVVLDGHVEILGQPLVRVRLRSDRPTGQIAFRLTEVGPDNKSWLVTWALLNLSYRESHAAPTELKPGQDYDLDVPLSFVAHRFRAGSRIRLAVSQSLWPLVWPAPEMSRLSLSLSSCSLVLPVRAAKLDESEIPAREIRRARSQEPDVAAPVARNEGGRYVFRVDEPSTMHIKATGLVVTRTRKEVAGIEPKDPNSCEWSQTASISWKSEILDCKIEASFRLSSTSTLFDLSESLEAWRDGEKIFGRATDRKIPRDLL